MQDRGRSVELESAVALPQDMAQCHALIQAQAAMLVELRAQVVLLQEQVNLNSGNSSKPPSSNGPAHPNRTQRRASQRKRGAQPGHKGHSRSIVDESKVERLIDCHPQAVCECGSPIQADAGAVLRFGLVEPLQ